VTGKVREFCYRRPVGTLHSVSNLVDMATMVGRGKISLAAFDGRTPKTYIICLKVQSCVASCAQELCSLSVLDELS